MGKKINLAPAALLLAGPIVHLTIWNLLVRFRVPGGRVSLTSFLSRFGEGVVFLWALWAVYSLIALLIPLFSNRLLKRVGAVRGFCLLVVLSALLYTAGFALILTPRLLPTLAVLAPSLAGAVVGILAFLLHTPLSGMAIARGPSPASR